MTVEFKSMLIEEYTEAESVQEVQTLTDTNTERGFMDADIQAAHDEAMERLGADKIEEISMETSSESARILELEKTIAELRAAIGLTKTPGITVTKIVVNKPVAKERPRTAKYRVLKFDAEWATQPQVHALLAILKHHLKEGDVVLESDIVRMVEANKSVLNTKQPAVRIWDYYKGEHDRGLLAHGNLEKVK